ncbi:MAG: zinc ABC transporter substrate-binding protein [Cognatishimia sp.]|uniref:zinc ABC transporter substrate-binding protein n=1 Tax=Cognatishimia sp. TaxID=2211648 RepID=UPI003B8E561D
MFYRTMTAICLLASQAQAEVPSVVTDIAPIHSLAARVMQGVGEPALLMKQGASPHGYSLRPSEARALQDSDLVIWMGEDLTPWLEGAVETLASKAHSLELLHTDGTHLLDFREEAVFGEHKDHDDHDALDDHDDKHGHDDEKHDDHHKDQHDDHHDEKHEDHQDEDKHDEHHDAHDEEKHDDHAGHDDHNHDGTDPHAWLAPENAIVWMIAIAAELAELDPANAELYAMNAEVGATEIEAAIEEITVQLAPLHNARFVVFHDAYQYFEEAFDLHVSGALHLSDATPPSAARLVEMQKAIKEHGITCVFAEPQFNDDLVAAVAPEGTNTGILDPLATSIPQGPALYTTWLRGLADRVSGCLS